MNSLFVFTCLLTWLGLISTAHAYTDPGFGALLFQMLAAVFVGGLYYFYKFRLWFLDLFRRIVFRKK